MFGEHAISKCYTFGRAIFNNSSVISWRSVLLVEETRGPGEFLIKIMIITEW